MKYLFCFLPSELPYRCLECSIGFKLKVHLNKHNLYRHSDVYKCECSTCGKRFKDTSALRLHERTHSTSRPFPCSRCLKSFKTRENLWGHQNRGPCSAAVINLSPGQDTKLQSGKLVAFRLASDSPYNSFTIKGNTVCGNVNEVISQNSHQITRISDTAKAISNVKSRKRNKNDADRVRNTYAVSGNGSENSNAVSEVSEVQTNRRLSADRTESDSRVYVFDHDCVEEHVVETETEENHRDEFKQQFQKATSEYAPFLKSNPVSHSQIFTSNPLLCANDLQNMHSALPSDILNKLPSACNQDCNTSLHPAFSGAPLQPLLSSAIHSQFYSTAALAPYLYPPLGALNNVPCLPAQGGEVYMLLNSQSIAQLLALSQMSTAQIGALMASCGGLGNLLPAFTPTQQLAVKTECSTSGFDHQAPITAAQVKQESCSHTNNLESPKLSLKQTCKNEPNSADVFSKVRSLTSSQLSSICQNASLLGNMSIPTYLQAVENSNFLIKNETPNFQHYATSSAITNQTFPFSLLPSQNSNETVSQSSCQGFGKITAAHTDIYQPSLSCKMSPLSNEIKYTEEETSQPQNSLAEKPITSEKNSKINFQSLEYSASLPAASSGNEPGLVGSVPNLQACATSVISTFTGKLSTGSATTGIISPAVLQPHGFLPGGNLPTTHGSLRLPTAIVAPIQRDTPEWHASSAKRYLPPFESFAPLRLPTDAVTSASVDMASSSAQAVSSEAVDVVPSTVEYMEISD